MARDEGFEELLRERLTGRGDLSTKAMFGGLAWLSAGRLLLVARHDGVLVRIGRDREAWAVTLGDVERMVKGGRPMRGWVWALPDIFENEAAFDLLVEAALDFVEALPAR